MRADEPGRGRKVHGHDQLTVRQNVLPRGVETVGDVEIADRDRFFTLQEEKEIAAAFQQISDGKLVDVSALLGNKYDIGLLRIFRAFATRRQVNSS